MHLKKTLLLVTLLVSCGDKGETYERSLYDYSPAEKNSVYSSMLAPCIVAETVETSCTLSELPLLGMEYSTVNIDNIMQRVVVSDKWMSDNFRQALQLMPKDLLDMFASVTAIVIGNDINPSYYNPVTGAMYISGRFLWLDNKEKKTIQQVEDPRIGYGDELQHLVFWRYVKNNQRAWDYYSLDDDQTRTIEDIKLPLASLLFHELAHANDYFPRSLMGNYDDRYAPAVELSRYRNNWASTYVESAYPLTSEMMFDLAQVRFYGEPASSEQKQLSAYEVGAEFSADIANDDYNYSSPREDVAMLFEEIMMAHHFGVYRDIAFLSYTDSESCADYPIKWGQRGRAGSDYLHPRARLVLLRLLNEKSTSVVDRYLQSLPQPIDIPYDTSWCDLSLSGRAAIQRNIENGAARPMQDSNIDHRLGERRWFK